MTAADAELAAVRAGTRSRGRVAVITLGCGRNDVDSDQVGGALQAAGFALVDEPERADCVLVNTCTFIGPAREESVEVVLDACDLPGTRDPHGVRRPPKVLVIGCMAERYRDELAEALPEVAGVLGFAAYPHLPEIVGQVLAGQPISVPADSDHESARHAGGLPIARVGGGPARTPAPAGPPTAGFPVRTLPRGPWAYLKIAGGCDRACTFCTIPSYRGRFASRPADALIAEASWLTANGARELVCVSENTTSWGKDLPGGRAAQQVALMRAFERVDGLERVRLLYLQPDELRSDLLDAMASSPVVAGYYDLSLQHASAPVLARMARSGDAERFCELISGIRARDPHAAFRSSFICGFPGETEADVEVLEQFLAAARLDWAGFFCYSPEDGTRSATLPAQVGSAEARARREHLTSLQELIADDAARAFVGRTVRVLLEHVDGPELVGRSHREAPETDGEVRLRRADLPDAAVGDVVDAEVRAVDGVDLQAAPARAPRGGRR